MILQDRQVLLSPWVPSAAGTKQPGFLAQCDVTEHVVGEFFVDDHRLGVEVCRDSNQSRAELGGLHLEIGMAKKGRHRAQHHRPNEGRHRGNALRHDDDHTIGVVYTMVAKKFRLPARAAAELVESYGLALIFVDPGSDKRAIAGSCVEGVDEIAKPAYTAVRHAAAHCSR